MRSVRTRKLGLALSWFLLGTFGFLSAASADTTPTMLWERGRQQSVTLGGNTADQLWTITLVGNSGPTLTFSKSSSNASGFLVYSVYIPADFPVGNYQVMIKGTAESSTVANVYIQSAVDFDPLASPRSVGGLAVIAFTLLSIFSNRVPDTSSGSQNSDSSDSDKADSAETNYQSIKIGRRGWFDGLRIGRLRVIFYLDSLRHVITYELASRSSLLMRMHADGSYLQALLGPLSILTYFAGVILGWECAVQTSGASDIVPTSFALFAGLLLLGIFDSLAGFLGAMTFGVYGLFHQDFNSVYQIRGFIGLAIIWFGPVLAANAMRPLRRKLGVGYGWERLGDLIIAPLFVGWSVKGMILILDGFTHVKNPIGNSSTNLAAMAGSAIFIRYLLEELAHRVSPARLEYLSPPKLPRIGTSYRIWALTFKTFTFLFFMYGFLGPTWQTFVSVAILILPSLIKIAFPKIPNSIRLFQAIPGGIPAMIFMNGLGLLTLLWINSLPIFAPDKTRTIFVLAALPGFLISILKLFGQRPAEGDQIWYRRPKNNVLYRVAGPLFIAVAFLMTIKVLP